MYQRFYKLFFKQYYAIADVLNGNSSSLTTQLSESTPSMAFARSSAAHDQYYTYVSFSSRGR